MRNRNVEMLPNEVTVEIGGSDRSKEFYRGFRTYQNRTWGITVDLINGALGQWRSQSGKSIEGYAGRGPMGITGDGPDEKGE